MEMKKRITSILLALVVALSCSVPAFAAEGLSNFKKVNAYASGQFKDVADGEWYTENVKTAYELGLMKGSGALFNIRGNINLAETLAIACRIRDTYYGGTGTFEQGSAWYQVYVDYAVANDIIVPGEYAEYTKPATRTQFAKIIAASVPESALNSINNVTSIPDVPKSAEYAKAVYLLYNAGILTGSDKYGTFNPESNISRSEVSAIVTRVAATSLRKNVELEVKPVEATGVKLDKSSLTLTAGKKATLTASVMPDNATDKTVIWTSSNPYVATVSNGTVTAKAEGTTRITASCGGFSVVCTVTVTPAPMIYTGRGDKVISGISLSRGAYYVEYTHNGRSNFIADLYHGADGTEWDLVANDIGVCSGRMLIGDALKGPITNGMIEVEADGDWTITIEKIAGTTSTNLKGTGDWVTGFFTAKQARNVCSYTNSGDSNFIVEIYSLNGRSYLAANDIGPCSGQKIVNLQVGQTYFFEIRAEGSWTFDMGNGDKLETISAPVAPSGGSFGSSGSGSSGSVDDYSGYDGVPDFGEMVGVSPISASGGSYIYKSSEVYAAAGKNALSNYLNLLEECGFKSIGGLAHDSTTMAFYENKSLGLTVRVSVTTISLGECIGISIS